MFSWQNKCTDIGKDVSQKNATRRNAQLRQMRGYDETLGHIPTSVHYTESILPATGWNVKENYTKPAIFVDKLLPPC